jgi:hypothetical protein
VSCVTILSCSSTLQRPTGEAKANLIRSPPVAERSCKVSVRDGDQLVHHVEVTADSMYEAAALALKALREAPWVGAIGPGTRLEVEVVPVPVRHEVSVQQLRRWAESTAATPAERLRKDRVKALLAPALSSTRQPR